MKPPEIKPGEITKPFQIYAVWFIGLFFLVGTFLTAAVSIKEPTWVTSVLAIVSIIIVIVFTPLIFILQTKFRKEFLEDPYYFELLKVQAEQFRNFKPEKVQSLSDKTPDVIDIVDESWETRESKRIQRYEKNRGLFLIHTWRPSLIAEEGADICINLAQHREGPLTWGKVKSVEYHLGPKFFTHTVTKTNADDDFALRITAYGPMLCVARVHFDDGLMPLDLERYINF